MAAAQDHSDAGCSAALLLALRGNTQPRVKRLLGAAMLNSNQLSALASVLQDASWLSLAICFAVGYSPADHALQTRAADVESTPHVTVRFRDRRSIFAKVTQRPQACSPPRRPVAALLATNSTMSSSAGVSELMDAEKKASTVVAEARAARSDRLGDDAAVLALSSGEEPASPRHRAGVASMA